MKWDRTKRGNVNLVQQYMAAGMSPDAAVEKAYPSWPAAKKQQLVAQMSGAPKTAGYTSELAGTLINPLNWFGVAPLVTGGIALGTPTRSDEEQAEADEETWKNLLIPGVAPYHGWKRLGHILDKKDSEKTDKKERDEAVIVDKGVAAGKPVTHKDEQDGTSAYYSDERGTPEDAQVWGRDELEKWQMTAKEDDPDIDEKGRRLKELQDADAKEKDHVKLGAPRKPWEDSPVPAPSIFNTLSRFIGMNPDRSSPEWEQRRTAHRRMSALRRFAGADTPTIRGQLAGGAIGGLTAGGAAAGGTIGGLYGLLSDPGEDEEGERRSRLVRALKGIAYGGGLGAVGGLMGGAAAGLGANYGGMLGGHISSNLSKEADASGQAAVDQAELEQFLQQLQSSVSQAAGDAVENPLTAFTSQLRGQLTHLKDEFGKTVKPLLGAGLGAATGGTLGGLAGGGAAAGSTIGGLYGLLSDPGKNKKGRRRSRLLRALKGVVYGGGLGALGGLAGGAGAVVGGLGGGLTGAGLGYNAFGERKASAMWVTDRDKNAARRVIEKAADIEGNLSSYLDDVGGARIPEEYVLSSMLRPPTATNTAIGAGLGGVIGALINYLREKSPVRGAFTGGLTGAGLAAGSDMAGNVGGGLGYWTGRPPDSFIGDGLDYMRYTGPDTRPPLSAIGRQLSSPVGAGLGGLGGYSLAQYLLNRDEKDEEKEAACRVISKVTSLVKDPKKHKWLDDSREGFGHWAGPPSVAKGDTEPKNVKAAEELNQAQKLTQRLQMMRAQRDRMHPLLDRLNFEAATADEANAPSGTRGLRRTHEHSNRFLAGSPAENLEAAAEGQHHLYGLNQDIDRVTRRRAISRLIMRARIANKAHDFAQFGRLMRQIDQIRDQGPMLPGDTPGPRGGYYDAQGLATPRPKARYGGGTSRNLSMGKRVQGLDPEPRGGYPHRFADIGQRLGGKPSLATWKSKGYRRGQPYGEIPGYAVPTTQEEITGAHENLNTVDYSRWPGPAKDVPAGRTTGSRVPDYARLIPPKFLLQQPGIEFVSPRKLELDAHARRRRADSRERSGDESHPDLIEVPENVTSAGGPKEVKGSAKNVKEAQKPLGEENLNLFAPNNPVPRGHLDPAIADRTLAAQMNDLQGLPVSAARAPAYDFNRQLRYKEDAAGNFSQDRTPVTGLDFQYPEHLGPRHPGPGGFIPSDDRWWNDEVTEKRRQQVLRKPVDDPDRASYLQTLDELPFEPGAQPGRGVAGNPNPNNPSPGGVRRRYEHIYRPRDPNRREDRFGNLIKENAAKHDCDKAHPGLTHKEWKALKGQRHDIQKNAGVSREALGAILGALLGGAGGYHMANQMAEPGSAIGGEVHPWRPGYPSNWKEGLMGAAATGIPSAALGGYIGRALTPRDEEEEEE